MCPLIKYENDIKLAQEYGINHRFCTLQHYSTYTDIFCFGNHMPLEKMVNFNMNNKELLEKFIIYFKNAAFSLLKLSEKYKITVEKFIDKDINNTVFNTSLTYQNLVDVIKNNKYQIKRPHGIVKITKRELECLAYTSHNLSAKEIAHHLDLSLRTIEEYQNILKLKLNVNSKLELSELIKNDTQLQSLIKLI
jgi:DNA-binding CsgD family transcriptional regulator